MTSKEMIAEGRTVLGMELGSTRIKAVLLGEDLQILASGSDTWESVYENGYWTYSLEAVRAGLENCYRDLKENVLKTYGLTLRTFSGMGISGMMHGYLPFDADGQLLVPFRTWRNTNAAQAAEKLSALFDFNVPMRWSVSHLYQAILDREKHVDQINFLTTLAGYVHYLLTGCRVLGVGDASGMFPIDETACDYDRQMMEKFHKLTENYAWTLRDILPAVLPAGADAGHLTAAGAKLLDPDGDLQPGIPLCPPEGDAGTGMTATNAVAPGTGNVSVGTSVFAMVVLEQKLSRKYEEIDMVTTPSGKPVAMVHCNNGTADMNAWTALFADVLRLMGHEADMGQLFTKLYQESLKGSADCDGITVCNYQAGEPITGFREGRPGVVRSPRSRFGLADFVRAQLYSVLTSLAAGMRILDREHVEIRRLVGHGGYFKTPGVGQKYLAAAVHAPVWVMDTAGEGGPYGMALLAAYRIFRDRMTLEEFLEQRAFAYVKGTVVEPEPAEEAGFAAYLERFLRGLPAEQAAVNNL